MKKIFILFIIALLISGCASNKDYSIVQIPDDKLGFISILNEWEIIEEDDWLYIVRIDSQEIIAFEYEKGTHRVSNSIETIDKKYNPFYENYIETGNIESITGSSNYSNVFSIEFTIEDEIINPYCIYFRSKSDQTYSVTFVFLDENIDVNVLIDVSKSYS